MKIIKRIGIWIVISLAAQVAVLLFLDRYYLKNDSDITTKKIENKQTNVKSNFQYEIPKNVAMLNFSFDSSYVSYEENGEFKVANTKNGNINSVPLKTNEKILNYQWLNDRNRMLLAQKVEEDGKNTFELCYYDAVKDQKEKIIDIGEFSNKVIVEQIKSSTLTGVTYIKLNTGGSRTVVYRLDRNNELTKAKLNSYVIDNIEVIPHEDRLVYEDKIKHVVYVTAPNKRLDFKNQVTLLGVDDNDTVYIGELNEDKITKIHFGKVEDNVQNWATKLLSEPMQKGYIHIAGSGNIFLNNNLKGVIKDLVNGKEYSYDGKFYGIYEGGFITIDNRKLNKVEVK